MTLGTTSVEEIMNPTVLTVELTDKLEDVAKLFESRSVNAAPVVDADGKCVGMITSHDLVEYESKRRAFEVDLEHGRAYDLAHYGDGSEIRLPGYHFHEVAFHMTKKIEKAERHFPLSQVARTMCRQHIHHVVVLNSEQRPIGIVSALDILGYEIGEPVSRPTYPEAT